MRTSGRIFALASVIVGLVVAGTTTAAAQYDEGEEVINLTAGKALLWSVPSDQDELVVDDPIEPGQAIRFRAGGFANESDVDIELHSDPVLLTTTLADRAGGIDVDVIVPETTEEGRHELRAIGTDPDGNERVVTVKFVLGSVGAAADDGDSSALPIGLAVGALVVLLGAAFVATRRRGSKSEPPKVPSGV